MQRADDVIIVGAVHGGNDDDIRASFADHLFELRRFPGGYRLCAFFLQQFIGVVHSGLIGIAKRDHFGIITPGSTNGGNI